MKIGTVKINSNGHKVNVDESGKIIFHLILENVDDVKRYAENYIEIESDKSIKDLMNFKQNSWKGESFQSFMAHESPTTGSVTKLMAFKLMMKETDTPISEYCNMCDGIMSEKIRNIYKHIINGNIVRINPSGGYCFVDDIDNYYIDLIEPTDKDISNFINIGTIDDDMIINSENIVIENDNHISLNLSKKLPKDYQLLNNFKLRTRNHTDSEIFDIFKKGLDNKLKNIYFETTGQDFQNIKRLYGLFLKLSSTDLKLYYLSDDNYVDELFSDNKNVFKI